MKSTFLVGLMILLGLNALNAQNPCDSVLQFTGRNIVAQSTELDRRSFVFEKICSGKYENSDSNGKLGLEAVIKQVPVGLDLGFGNKTEKVKNWCSSNTDVELLRERAAIFSSQVYEPSISAWTSCNLGNNESIRFEPTLIDDTVPVFTITNKLGGGATIEIRDLGISDASTACTVSTAGTSAIAKFGSTFDRITIGGGANASIRCTRTPEKKMIGDKEANVFPEVSISILTSVKDYQMKLPTKNAFLISEDRMNEIISRLARLEQSAFVKVDSSCMRINKTQICWGRMPLTPDPPSPHTAIFKFEFEKEFASPPNVTTGIHANDNGLFLAVYRHSVNTKEFSGRVTHQRPQAAQIPGGAVMNYVAVGEAKDN